MSLLWFDGFESYNNDADATAVPFLSTAENTFSTNYGRRGSRGFMQNHYNDSFNINLSYTDYFPAPANNTTIIVGHALYANKAATPYDSPGRCLIHLGWQVGVYFKHNTNILQVRRINGTILGTGTTTLGSQWWFFEIKVYIHDTAGTVEVRLNGNVEILVTGIDTKHQAHNYVPSVGLRSGNSNPVWRDDLYICNAQGSKNNDFLGDIRVDALRPNAAGIYTDFTPSAGSNYQNVDESYGPDDDSAYNQDDILGHQDSYGIGSLPSPPVGTTIHGVKSQITVRKVSAGSKQCKLLTRAGTTDDLGNAITLSDVFTTHPKIFENNPDDSAAWEDADVNGMEVGAEVTS